MKMFTTAQLTRLWVIFNLSATLPFMLQLFFKYTDYQGLFAFLGGYILSLFLAYFVVFLAQSNQGQSFIQTGKNIVGKSIHNMILFLVMLYCLTINSLNLYEFSEFLGFIYLKNTPNFVIGLIFIASAAITAYAGFKTIVYMSDGFFILLILTIVVTTPVFFQNLDLSASIAIVTQFELPKFLFSSLYVANWTSDFIIALFFLSSFQTKGKTMKAFLIAQTIVMVVMILYWFLILLLFGPHLGGHLRYPLLELLRFFEIGEILENADPLIVSIWASTLLIRSSLLLYITTEILCSFFYKKEHKNKIIPIIVVIVSWLIIIGLANYPSEFHQFNKQTSIYIFFSFKLIPIFYFIVYKLRPKKHLINKS